MFAPRGVVSFRSGTRVEPEQLRRPGVPTGFEAVGEALASERGVAQACAAVGHGQADDGRPLVEVLAGLRQTSLAVTGRDPSYDAVTSLAGAWSEATLGYLHQLSCEDPLSGLATPAHLRTRLAELFRLGGDTVASTRGLVVLELPRPGTGTLDTTLRVTRAANLARTVWPGEETLARVAALRVVVLARRDDTLGRRVRLLRSLVGADVRLWVEAVPRTEANAAALLDELARD